jgi:hypothetical protein
MALKFWMSMLSGDLLITSNRKDSVDMATLYGKTYGREELLKRVGDISQIGGVKPIELVNGNERGVRAALFKTGTGFNYTVRIQLYGIA